VIKFAHEMEMFLSRTNFGCVGKNGIYLPGKERSTNYIMKIYISFFLTEGTHSLSQRAVADE
jgi:hypothetical protein